jgi:hypothetical protein
MSFFGDMRVKWFEKVPTEREKVELKARAQRHIDLLNQMSDKLSGMFTSPQNRRLGGKGFAGEAGGINDTVRLLSIITVSDIAALDPRVWPTDTVLPSEIALPKVLPKLEGTSRNQIDWVQIPGKNIKTPWKLLEELESKVFPPEIIEYLKTGKIPPEAITS